MSLLPRITCLLLACSLTATADLSRLKADGTHITNEQGDPVILQGVNLGNWLLLEMDQMELRDESEVKDQYDFETLLEQRFGLDGRNRLMETFRSHWITEKDFATIASFGMNVIRLPIHYAPLATEGQEDWRWIDWCLEQAEQNGLYVILDLHGAPGGQNPSHHCGRRGQNRLWTSPLFQQQTASLWKRMAMRYRGRNVVAAYDLLNEPYGATPEQLVDVMDQLYHAVRSVDRDTLVFIAGSEKDFTFYGPPQERGWENVGITMHYYPGYFGDGDATLETHYHFLEKRCPAVQNTLEQWRVPFLIGEYNPIHAAWETYGISARYLNTFAKNGWASALWSYKTVGDAGWMEEARWAMTGNRDLIDAPDLTTATEEEISAWFKGFSTMAKVFHEPLRKALNTSAPPPAWPAFPPTRLKPPATETIPGWTGVDIGGARSGGEQTSDDGTLSIYAGGGDIWGSRDQFRFLHQSAPDQFTLEASVLSSEETHVYAKTGLMLRSSTSPTAAHLFIAVQPDGRLEWAHRPSNGSDTETVIGSVVVDFPVTLRIHRDRHGLGAAYRDKEGNWQTVDQRIIPDLAQGGQLGPAVCSHANHRLTKAVFTQPLLTTPGVIDDSHDP